MPCIGLAQEDDDSVTRGTSRLVCSMSSVSFTVVNMVIHTAQSYSLLCITFLYRTLQVLSCVSNMYDASKEASLTGFQDLRSPVSSQVSHSFAQPNEEQWLPVKITKGSGCILGQRRWGGGKYCI